jgi:hypothetical protein
MESLTESIATDLEHRRRALGLKALPVDQQQDLAVALAQLAESVV